MRVRGAAEAAGRAGGERVSAQGVSRLRDLVAEISGGNEYLRVAGVSLGSLSRAWGPRGTPGDACREAVFRGRKCSRRSRRPRRCPRH